MPDSSVVNIKKDILDARQFYNHCQNVLGARQAYTHCQKRRF